MTGRFNRSSAVLGLLAVTIATIICVSITALSVNAQCQATFDNHTPIYPGAEIRQEEYNFLGRKMMVLYTPDSAYDVENWYHRARALAVSEDVKNQTRTAWGGIWMVEPAPDRPGSLITLKVPCGQY